MRLYLTTLRRLDQPYTLRAIPQSWHDRLSLVVQSDERDGARALHPNVIVKPDEVVGLSKIRQWILEYHLVMHPGDPSFVLLDDDLRFFVRVPGTIRLVKVTEHDMETMLSTVEESLNSFAHVSVSAREGNNREPEECAQIRRALRVLGYRADILAEHGMRFDRLPCMSDFDMTLQVLRSGHPNLVWFTWAQDQTKGSNAAGGCSLYRTPQMLKESAEGLAALHPGFVDVRQKETTSNIWFDGAVRTDVTVFWRKAFNSSHA